MLYERRVDTFNLANRSLSTRRVFLSGEKNIYEIMDKHILDVTCGDEPDLAFSAP